MNTRKHPGAQPKHIAAALLSTLFAAVLFLSSCSNDPIFAAIEEEVELIDPSVRGSVTSLVAVAGDLYVTNGRIYKRTGGAGDWNEIGMPSGAYYCAGLAIDDTDGTELLYGLFFNEDWTSFHSVQRFNGSSWSPITGLSAIKKIGNGKDRILAFTGSDTNYSIFQAPSVGTTFLATAVKTSIDLPIGSISAGTTDYFATSTGIFDSTGTILPATNAPTAGIKGITSFGTNLYVVTSTGTIYFFNGTIWGLTQVTPSLSTPATSITYLDFPGTTNLLLVGASGGYSEVLINETNGSMFGTQTPGTSLTSSLSTTAKSQYESSLEQWNLTSIFAVTSPVPAGNDYVVYAGVTDTRYDGLWAYYSNTRQEWNRE